LDSLVFLLPVMAGQKILIIGSGGREHALAWKLKQSRNVDRIFCAPGNAGISLVAKTVNIKAENIRGLADFAHRNRIHLTIVGPEKPLTMGIVDEFQRRNLRIFGPNRSAARLEGSKVFAKEFMKKHHIPTAPFTVFDSFAEAIGFCKTVQFPVVIKADGLAAGKGVIVVNSLSEAEAAIRVIMVDKQFGKAGKRIVVESFMRGSEISIMAVTDSITIRSFLPSQDHKQAYDGDKGPNTGGMGAYCPVAFVNEYVQQQITDYVLQPFLAGLKSDNINFRGVIYAGLMLTDSGPKVLEFNCRFGDPETQVVIPMLKTDLLSILRATADGKLSSIGKFQWRKGAAACVVMASKGYPGNYKTGRQITGLQDFSKMDAQIFHAGTRREGKRWLTAGGRVLGVVGFDRDLKASLEKTYKLVNRVKFDGAMYRRDIGLRKIPETPKLQATSKSPEITEGASAES